MNTEIPNTKKYPFLACF